MSNYVISLIRTWVPIAIGSVIAWLAAHGLNLDPSATGGFEVFLTGVLSGAWYALARLLEAKFPWLGVLLGVPAKLAYKRKAR